MINRLSSWRDATFVAFDLETTGKYPLEAEICEVAAVKYHGGKIVGEFHSLVKPTAPMGDFVISIHNITNEMVANAPPISEVAPRFRLFLGDAVPVAHHAPFDLGFMAWEFEKLALDLPPVSALCTALISRRALPASPNHRLQTLVKYLGLPAGQAHRALDDAKACMDVALKCFERIGPEAKLDDIYKFQGSELKWSDYSINSLSEKAAMLTLVSAIKQKARVELVYSGGSRPGQPRELNPIGIVRNPNGDFLVAREPGEDQTKRFFLSQITSVKILN
jgi:DNA polymerase-3 subunit epsilon